MRRSGTGPSPPRVLPKPPKPPLSTVQLRATLSLQPESDRKTVLLLRHGAIARNPQRRFIGSTDLPLSATGLRQATAAARCVRDFNPERCFSSPMRRCTETARAVTGDSALELEILPELREIDFGEWEGMTFEEIKETKQSSSIERWAGFDPAFCFPGGEQIADFSNRVQRVALQISSVPQKSVLVVTHGGVIRVLICLFLGLAVRNYVLFEPGPGSLTVINHFGPQLGTLAALVPFGRTEDV